VAALQAVTGGRGVDVVLDIVGGGYLARNLEVLAVDGRLVQIGLQEGARAEIGLRVIMAKRLTITGSLLRPRSVAEKGAIARAVQAHVWPLLESRAVAPVVHATFPLREAAAAHRLIESGAHIGKIVLTV
jgi:NADPH:quinone reductase-like Zn-dependent oxidoreductase